MFANNGGESLPNNLDGSYTLLAQVTDPASNTAATHNGPAVTIVPDPARGAVILAERALVAD